MLAAKFSNSFKQVERLASENEEVNKQLKIHSENLEELVELRTNELKIINKELESVNFELKSMIAYAQSNERKFRSLFENIPEGVFR